MYFIEPNVTPEDQAPRWVEWVNDSSANVVFGTPEACGGAALAKTVPLMPNAQGIDTQSWRTMPDSQAGKGLQLLFRIATVRREGRTSCAKEGSHISVAGVVGLHAESSLGRAVSGAAQK